MSNIIKLELIMTFVSLFLISGVLLAQVNKSFCKTNFYDNKLFHVNIPETLTGSNDPDIIPIALHIITDSNGEGNEMTAESFLRALDSINQYLIQVELRAELCVLNIVPDDENVNALIDFDGQIIDSLHESGYVNIFMPNTVNGNDGEGNSTIIGGLFTDDDFLFILGKGATYGLIAHELGHFFGLYHTFETRFGEELVNRSNCDRAGDLLCDTDADHGLQRTDVDSINCTWLYPNTVFDSNNEAFDPSTTNFMSYSQLHCIREFSQEQLLVIRNTYDLNVPYLKHCETISGNHEKPGDIDNILVYPNPSENVINIDINKVHSDIRILLHDCMGRSILEKTVNVGEQIMELNIQDLPSGHYFLSISTRDYTRVRKICIVR